LPLLRRVRKLVSVLSWRFKGSPVLGPTENKPAMLLATARERGLRVLVETGTYMGGTIEATKTDFDEIWSIELDERLHDEVAKRYRADPRIHCLQGDSGTVIAQVLAKLDRPALFWLDAHYSSGLTAWTGRDTPVLEELSAIMSHPVKGHVILVDDAQLFGPDPAYPTLDQVRELAHRLWPSASVTVADDIIWIS